MKPQAKQLFSFCVGVGLLLLASPPAFAEPEYGKATLTKGTLTVVRQGETLTFDQEGQEIPILKQDILRVGADSLVELNTQDQAQVQIGAHGIFQVSPWKQAEQSGYLRMLYGKARFKKEKTEQSIKRGFFVKSSRAVIGVKGTEWEQQTSSTGVTDTVVTEGTVAVGSLGGELQEVNQGESSVVVSAAQLPKKIPVPPKEEKSGEGQSAQPAAGASLAAPQPTSEASAKLDREGVYVEQGAATQEEFNQSSQQTVGKDDSLEGAAVVASSQGSTGDEEFDADFNSSQDVKLEVILPNLEANLQIAPVTAPTVEQVKAEDLGALSSGEIEGIIQDLGQTLDDAAVDALDATGKLEINFEK